MCNYNIHYSNFADRWHMKRLIGVTREPEKIKDYLYQHHGQDGTLIEVGPFVSRLDAMNWLAYHKNRIGHFEEIISSQQPEPDKQALWYGFTFEQPTQH